MSKVSFKRDSLDGGYPIQGTCQRIARIVLGSLFCVLSLGACSRRYDDFPVYTPIPFKDYDNHGVGRFKTSYLVDQIDNYYRGANPGPIGITTFVNIDDLHSTSTFGRMLGEQVMSELAIRGFDVVELRHADALQFLSDAGEFALSRDVSSVRRTRDLGGVVVGTYVVSPERVYVNARLIDPASSLVLSAASVEMSKTDEIARLLRGGSLPGTLERIPVRHLGYATFPMSLYPQVGRVYEEEDSPGTPRFYDAPKPVARAPRAQRAPSPPPPPKEQEPAAEVPKLDIEASPAAPEKEK